MEFLTILFRLAVVFAIFGFIWGIINLAIGVLTGARPKSYPLKLSLKAIQFFLIADVSVLFVMKSENWGTSTIVATAIILSAYFIGKMSSMQLRFSMQINGMNMQKPEKPNYTLEWGVIFLAMSIFSFLFFYPQFAENKLSSWFFTTIIGIEKAPFFGFIFKIVGFVIALTIFLRLINTISLILNGRNPFENPFEGTKNKHDDFNNQDQTNDTHYDDYQEVKD